MKDIINDVCSLTTIKLSEAQRFIEALSLCISSALYETQLQGEVKSDLDIGIGTLEVEATDEEILYKFTPNKKLEKQILSALDDHEDPLVKKLEFTFKNRIFSTYKDLF